MKIEHAKTEYEPPPFLVGQRLHQKVTAMGKRSAPLPVPVRPPVLVILLVERGGYLLLHQPQLLA